MNVVNSNSLRSANNRSFVTARALSQTIGDFQSATAVDTSSTAKKFPISLISSPRQNELLASMSEDELALLMPHLELVNLSSNKELYEFGKKVDYAYFPISAIASLVYVLEDGSMTEIAVVGREGMIGISLIMGEGAALGSTIVHSAGFAYRIDARVLTNAFQQGGALQAALLRYTQMLIGQMARNTVSSRHYSIEQQLCRWLLERLDRLSSSDIKVTHELVANLLGVRRESVTQAAGKLQDEGLIQTSRGNITVLDRRGLELHAGECYFQRKSPFVPPQHSGKALQLQNVS